MFSELESSSGPNLKYIISELKMKTENRTQRLGQDPNIAGPDHLASILEWLQKAGTALLLFTVVSPGPSMKSDLICGMNDYIRTL